MLTDIPKYKKVKKRGKSLNNYEERDNFYFETLNTIIEKCSSQKVVETVVESSQVVPTIEDDLGF